MAEIGKDETEEKCGKMSHKKWKALQKKLKRKEHRQREAASRDELLQTEEEVQRESACNLAQVAEEERKANLELERLEFVRKRQHALWIEREHRALLEIAAKKDREAKERKYREEEDQRIREEFEQQQKKEKEEELKRLKDAEELEKKNAEKKQKQKDLLKAATANEKAVDGENWHNPIAPRSVHEDNVERCPFYQRTGACRFGDRCSRAHDRPESSSTLLIPGMYSHYELEQSLLDEYDTDLSLEYEDSELYRSFVEFYKDVLPEFKSVGTVIQFKVCCNHEPHLRGNVYIQFSREEYAQAAFMKFNGRWYAGKQLSCEFTAVNKWQPAICGLLYKKKCPKGKNCNFLHVFKNPGNEFWEADRDYAARPSQRSWSVRSRRSRSRSPYRRRNRSRSPRSRSKRPRSRSRDRANRHRRSRSRSRSRSTRSNRRRSRSRSTRDRSRSRSPLYRHRRSRTPVRESNGQSGSQSTSSKSHDFEKETVKFVSKKPISFKVKTKESSHGNKVRVESLTVWNDPESEPLSGESKEVKQNDEHAPSPDSSKSRSDEEENHSAKKHKLKKQKKKHKKSKKRKSEKSETCTERNSSEKNSLTIVDNENVPEVECMDKKASADATEI